MDDSDATTLADVPGVTVLRVLKLVLTVLLLAATLLGTLLR
ncbi:MAG: hypothetical protein ABEJ80_01855 [Halarchaeum sp.]